MYITFVNEAEPTLTLNPRGDVTRNPRGGSRGMYITFVNEAELTLALNPRGDVTRNPNQWPQKRTTVSAKTFFLKKRWGREMLVGVSINQCLTQLIKVMVTKVLLKYFDYYIKFK